MRIRRPRGKYKTTCSKCAGNLEIHRLGKYRYCLSCHRKNMRENRPKHRDLSPEQKMKANARGKFNVRLNRGKIQKQPCCICGDLFAEAHHEDYSKPYDVIWYCRKHHLEHHKPKRQKKAA